MNRDEILIQKLEWERDFIAGDGLMRLPYDSLREPFPGQTKTTTPNDNGILFSVYYYFLLDHHECLEPEDRERFYDSIKSLEKNHTPGLYNRNPGRNDDYEALDNYVAICAGSVLFDFSFQRDICDYGDRNGYIFNNVSDSETYLHQWRQGAEIAYYQLCAGRMPQLWNLIWFYLSFVVSAFYSEEKSSEHLLTWLRLKSLERAYLKVKQGSPWFLWAYWFSFLFATIWKYGLLRQTSGRGIERELVIYFRQAHDPHVVLGREVKF
jgi:hypothetical protein